MSSKTRKISIERTVSEWVTDLVCDSCKAEAQRTPDAHPAGWQYLQIIPRDSVEHVAHPYGRFHHFCSNACLRKFLN